MTDEKAVLAVIERTLQAWANGDADSFVDDYLDDATVTLPGVFYQGRRALRDATKVNLAGPLKGSRAADEPQDVRVIDGKTAIVISNAGAVLAGESAPRTPMRATWVLCKRGDDWRIASYANTPA